jgi:hypothetical protein
MFKPSKDSSRIPDDQGVSYCLASLFSTWIKEQRSAEKKMGLHLFTPNKHAYLGDAKKYRCVLPPSRQHCPKAEDVTKSVDKRLKFHLSLTDFKTMNSALSLASCSALP